MNFFSAFVVVLFTVCFYMMDSTVLLKVTLRGSAAYLGLSDFSFNGIGSARHSEDLSGPYVHVIRSLNPLDESGTKELESSLLPVIEEGMVVRLRHLFVGGLDHEGKPLRDANGELHAYFNSRAVRKNRPYTFHAGKSEVIEAIDKVVVGAREGQAVVVHASADSCFGALGFSKWGIPANASLLLKFGPIEIVQAA